MNPAVSIGRILAQKGCVRTINRGMASPAPWNYLWKPGPYPEGTDERIAAAKKYGMIVEDYRPYEDKDVLAGDYPMLPIDPMAERDALYPWDHPELRRNYGEPLQEEWWKYHDTRVSPMTNYRVTRGYMYRCQLLALTTILVLAYLTSGHAGIPKTTQQVLDQQLVTEGITHYTFDVPE
eukprot:TRINITY_DN2938_c0_g1_i1.p1 TRINITY_DN2938_c0_g1~~TRINITY_DN2938_c0_g1_i1.p1  ORF type:complete len:179 (-),score=38.72 TRINITY_DN2938_c0_g1_i1:82-618(-)